MIWAPQDGISIKASIAYDDNAIEVKGVKIWHNNQFVEIEGVASSLPADSISVRLADIDVGYIFDTLKINYVTFGGIASGEVKGIGVLGLDPHAATENLFIKRPFIQRGSAWRRCAQKPLGQ